MAGRKNRGALAGETPPVQAQGEVVMGLRNWAALIWDWSCKKKKKEKKSHLHALPSWKYSLWILIFKTNKEEEKYLLCSRKNSKLKVYYCTSQPTLQRSVWWSFPPVEYLSLTQRNWGRKERKWPRLFRIYLINFYASGCWGGEGGQISIRKMSRRAAGRELGMTLWSTAAKLLFTALRSPWKKKITLD